MDPQASLTQGLFGPQATEDLPPRSHRRRPLRRRLRSRPRGLIRPTAFERDRVVAGSNGAGRLQRPPAPGDRRAPARPPAVPEGGPRRRFDVALIDCPPNLSLCSWAALLAADFVVVPVQAEDYGAQGIVYIQRAFDMALAHHNPRLRLARLPGDDVQQVAGDPHRLRAPAPGALRRPGLRRDGPAGQGLQGGRRRPPAGGAATSRGRPRPRRSRPSPTSSSSVPEAAAARPAEFLYLGHRVGPKDLAGRRP